MKEFDCRTATLEEVSSVHSSFRIPLDSGHRSLCGFAGWFDVHFKVRNVPTLWGFKKGSLLVLGQLCFAGERTMVSGCFKEWAVGVDLDSRLRKLVCCGLLSMIVKGCRLSCYAKLEQWLEILLVIWVTWLCGRDVQVILQIMKWNWPLLLVWTTPHTGASRYIYLLPIIWAIFPLWKVWFTIVPHAIPLWPAVWLSDWTAIW